MKVYCQNFDKHDPGWKGFRLFGVYFPQRQVTPILYEPKARMGETEYYCPVCQEFVDVGPEMYASWGPLETRAGWPKSMIRKM